MTTKGKEHIEVTDLLDDFEREQEIEEIKDEILEVNKKLKEIVEKN